MTDNTSPTPQPSDFNSTNTDINDKRPENKVTLEIVRHGWLFNLLQTPHNLWKLFNFLFALLIVLMVALGTAVIIIKQFFPYNTITTSLYGNTTLRSEDKDVTYWLFNTAELWANSGIEVKKGDVLTIRASGASHTAIHHLARDVEKNSALQTFWNDTRGASTRNDEERDSYRRRFRIAPHENEGVLLMQVIPTKVNDKSLLAPYLDGHHDVSNECIYVIGKERQNLVIQQDGILYFAVNDVALTDEVIAKMLHETIKLINNDSLVRARGLNIPDHLITDVINTKSLDEARKVLNRPENANIARLINKEEEYSLRHINKIIDDTYGFSGYTVTSAADTTIAKHPLINELLYYKHKGFTDAWYVDNLGSFLIVVERTKKS